MELSAVGESVFAAESIIKRRIRRVFAAFFSTHTPCPRAKITQPFLLCGAATQSADTLTILRVCFCRVAGNIS